MAKQSLKMLPTCLRKMVFVYFAAFAQILMDTHKKSINESSLILIACVRDRNAKHDEKLGKTQFAEKL